MGLATLLLATSFIVGSIAGPVSQLSESQCATRCTESSKFEYEVGKSFIYQYEATTKTELLSNQNEATSLLIRATVEIQSQTKCNFNLKLRDVEIRHPERNVLLTDNSKFKTVLEANYLDFSFQDGVVEAVCPSQSEPVWALNIKRGILSMFQNSMGSWNSNYVMEETDITGKCLTNYRVNTGGWTSDITISKTKHMLQCTDRSDHYTWMRSTPHQPSIVPKSSPLINSNYECEQTIRNKILQKSTCKESHRFQPFANENNGAATNIQQQLTYQKTVSSYTQSEKPVTLRSNLLFDHDYEDVEKNSQRDAREALGQLCQSYQDDVRPEGPQLFARLVNTLNKLSLDELQSMFNDVNNICTQITKAKKLFMDAVAMTGSEAGVVFMTRHILEKRSDSSEIDRWLTTLSLLPKPTKEVIRATMPLLQAEGHRSKALLTISALTHAYCQQENECSGETEVVNVMKNIVDQFPPNCQTKDETTIERIVILLKALGNIGYIDQALPIVQKCYENRQNPIQVRLAAIEAHRRLPCTKNKGDILATFLDREEDSEVRIGAYLMVMKCPSQTILDNIEESLISEDVNQVGSFVWTHLTSLKSSENPNKSVVKQILSSKKLQKKFSTDVRKFSRYFENSIFLDSVKAGAHLDGSVIFSPKSYLPRSTNLGLNLDIFGESVDLFEIGGRLEGFEQLVEALFGTEGYFPDETIKKMLASYRDKKSSENSKLNEITRMFNFKNAKADEPQGAFYAKMFGNEMMYLNFKGFDQLLQRTEKAFIYMDKLAKIMRGENVDFVENVVLLDSSITIPTSIGFPLNLKVNGTAALQLKMGGNIDTSQISTKSLVVKGYLKPSAAVEINGAMIVNGYVAQSGLKLTSMVHTSTEVEGELIVKDGQTIKSQIKLPKDKVEIFNFKSAFLIVENQKEREVKSEQPQQQRMCTGDFVSKYLGLELCGEMASSSSIFKGPIDTRIYLQKTDKLLTTYDFEYKWSKEMVATKSRQPKYMRIGKLSLDTHKSAVNRELTAEFVHNEADETVSLRLVSPIKKATFNGKLINDPDHKKLDLLILIDDKECLAFQNELRIDNTGSTYRLTPSMAIRWNGQPIINLKGSVLTQDRKKYSVEFTMEHVTEQPITITGLASKSDRNGSPRYEVDFNINSKILQTYGKWFYQSGSTSTATKGTIDYKWSTYDKESITFSAKGMTSQQNAASKKLNLEAEFQWTLYPMANWIMTLDMQRSEDQMDNTFTLYYGEEQHHSYNMFSVQHVYRGHGSWPKHHIASTVRVVFPPANIAATVDLKSDLTSKSLDTSFVIQLTSEKKLSLITSIKRGDETRKELFSGYTRLSYPDNQLEISGSVAQPEADSLVLTVAGKWGEKNEASTIVSIRNYGPNKPKSWGKEVTIEIRLPEQQPLVLAGDIVISDEERSAHGEAQINGQTYKTFAEYYRPSLENLRVKAGAKSPSNTYSVTSDVQYADREKRFDSEVILGGDHRIKSTVQMRNDGESRSAIANLITDANNYPDKIYSMQMVLHNIIRGSEGVITINIPPSSEYGFEWKCKTNGDFGNGPATLNAQYQAWWAPGKKITADVELIASFMTSSREISTTVKLNTPWTKEITLYGLHKDNGQRWNSNIDVRHDKEAVFSAVTDGICSFYDVDNTQKLRFNLKLSRQEPLITFKVDHQLHNKMLRTNLIVNSGQKNELRLGIQAEDRRTTDVFSIGGQIDIVTPYDNFQKLSVDGNVTMGTNNVAIETELNWNNNIFTADFSSNYKPVAFNGELAYDINVRVTTPFEKLSSINYLLKYSHSYVTGKIDGGINLIWNRYKKVTLDTFIDAKNSSAFIHFTSPFDALKDILLVGNIVVMKNEFDLNLKLQWALKQLVVANLSWKNNYDDNLYYKFNAESTVKQLPFKFGTEVEIIKQINEFKAKFSGYFNDKVALLNVDLSRSNSSFFAQPSKWLAQFQLQTPFSILNNLNLTLKSLWDEQGRLNSQIEAAHNDQVITGRNYFSMGIDGISNSLVIKLPFDVLKEIKLEMKQGYRDNVGYRETNLSWIPGPCYTFIEESSPVKPDTAAENIRIDYKSFYAPAEGMDKTKLLEVNIVLPLRFQPSSFDGSVIAKYKEQEIFETTVSYKNNLPQKKGSGRLHISLASTPVKSLSMTYNYDCEQTLKSASLEVDINDLEPISIKSTGQFVSPKVEFNLDIVTPFEILKTGSIKYDFDYAKVNGQVGFAFNGKKFTLDINGEKGKDKGNYVIRLTTPVEGFESMLLSADADLSDPRNRRVTIAADGNLGQIKLQTYYRKSRSLNAGAVFTSSIPSYEKVTFDYLGENQVHTVSLNKGSHFKINSTITYKGNQAEGNIKINFNSPWVSTSLQSNWVNNYRIKNFQLKHVVNELVTEFEFLHQMDSKDTGSFKTSLVTPSQTISNFKLQGQYKFVNPVAEIHLSLDLNNRLNLNLAGRLQQNDRLGELTFTSSIPNYEKINLKGNLKANQANMIHYTIELNDKSLFLLRVQSPKESSVQAEFYLASPVKRFDDVQMKMNYGIDQAGAVSFFGSINSIQVQINYKVPVQGQYLLDIHLNLPVEKYSVVASKIQLDIRPKQKQIFDFLLQFGDGEKYQVIAECDTSHAGYSDFNIKLSSPAEESRIYFNYNLNDHSFDVKLSKGKTMMETRGRFHINPEQTLTVASFTFNTNYKSLISVSSNGQLQTKSDKIEFVLQANVNGNQNELKGTLTNSASGIDVDINGYSSYPQWQKFSLGGSIKKDGASRHVQLTLTRNEVTFAIQGDITKKDNTWSGKLVVTTPYMERQSIQIEFENKAGTTTIKITNDSEELITIKIDQIRVNTREEINFDFKSSIPWVGPIKSKLIFDSNIRNPSLQLNFNSESLNFDLTFNGVYGERDVKYYFDLNSSVKLPLINDDNLKIRMNYSLVNIDFSLEAMTKSKLLVQIQVSRELGRIQFKFYVEPLGNINMYALRPPLRTEIFRERPVSRWNRAEIYFEFSGLWSEKILLTAGYDVSTLGIQVPNAYLTVRKGERVIELSTAITYDDKNNQLKFALKTPFRAIENVSVFASIKKSPYYSFDVSARLSRDKHISLNGLYNPQTEQTITDKLDFLTLSLKSSIENYENLRFAVKKSSSMKSGEVSIMNGRRKIYLEINAEKPIEVNYVNTFVHNLRKANLKVDWSSSSIDFKFELDEHKVIEAQAQLESRSQSVKWTLSMKNDFLPQSGLFKLTGNYNVIGNNNYNMMLAITFENLNLLDASFESKPYQLKLSLQTMLENIKNFEVLSTIKTETRATNVNVNVVINDQRYSSAGRLAYNNNNDGYSIEVTNNFAVAGVRDAKFVTKRDLTSPKKLLGGELHANGKRLGSVEGSIEINYPELIDAKLQIDTPWFKSEDLNVFAKYDKVNGNILARFQWSATEKIEIKGKLSSSDIQVTLFTPFASLDQVSCYVKILSLSKEQIHVTASIVHQNEVVTGFEFKYTENLPRQLQVNLELITPFENYKQPSILLSYSNDGTKAGHRWMNLSAKTDFKIKLSENYYGVENKVKFDNPFNLISQTTITTPWKSLATVKIDVETSVASDYQGKISLTIPSSKHTIGGKFILKSDKIDVELTFDSSSLTIKPVIFKFELQVDNFNIELNINEVKRYIQWTHRLNEEITGRFTMGIKTQSEISGYQWNYILALSKSQFETSMKDLNSPDDLITIKFSLKEFAKIMDLTIDWKSSSLLSVHYDINEAPLEANLKLNIPMIATLIRVNFHWDKNGGALRLFNNNEENYVKVDVQQNAGKYNFQVDVEAPTFRIPHCKIEGSVIHKGTSMEGVIALLAKRETYKISGRISRDVQKRSAEFRLVNTLHNIDINSTLYYEGYTNFGGFVTGFVNSKRHTASVAVKLDKDTDYSIDLLIDTPLVNRISVNIKCQPRFGGEVTLTVGQIIHKGLIKVHNNDQETIIEVAIDTPTTDVKSLSLQSTNHEGRYGRSVRITSSTASHSLSLDEARDTRTRKLRLTADTPYFKGGPYTLTGQNSKNDGFNEMSLDLNTPTERHYVQINIFKVSSGGTAVRATMFCPLLAKSEIQLTTTIKKFDKSNVIGSMELNQGQIKHKLSVDVQLKDRSLNYDIALQTPLFNINSVESKGQFSISSDRQVSVDVTFKKSETSYALKGYFKQISRGIDGQLKVETPYFPSTDVSSKISWDKPGELTSLVVIQTPTTKHTFELNLNSGNNSFNGLLRLNSPLLPDQLLTVTGNINFRSSLSVRSYIAVENPKNIFKLSSELKSEPENDRVISHLIVITPFAIAPYIKYSGQWTKTRENIEGEFEIYTVEKSEPDLGIYISSQHNGQRLTAASINVVTTQEKLRNVLVKYDAAVPGKSSFLISLNKVAYGYEFEHVRLPGQRQINVGLFWGDRKSTFGTEITGNEQRYSITVRLDPQIDILPLITFQLSTDRKTELGLVLNIGEQISYFLKAKQDYTSIDNFKIELILSDQNFKAVKAIISRLSSQEGENVKLQWFSNERIQWDILISTSADRRRGEVRIKTPLDALKEGEITYDSYDNMLKVTGKLNNQTTVLKSSRHGDEGVVQLYNNEHVITFTYTLDNTKFSLSIPHHKYPLTFTILKKSYSRKVYNYLGKFSWGNDEYSQITLNADLDLQEPNYKLQLAVINPLRTIRLSSYCSTAAKDEITASVHFTWDLADKSKAVGFNMKQQNIASKRHTELDFIYPGINKITIRTQAEVQQPIDYLLEVVYGPKPTEIITLVLKRQHKVFEIRLKNPETNYDVQFAANCKENAEQWGASVLFSYIDQYNKLQRYYSEHSLLKHRNQFILQLSTSESKMKLISQIQSIENGYALNMEGIFDDKTPNKLEIQFRRAESLKGFDIFVYNDFGTKGSYSLNAGMPDSSTIQLVSKKSVNDKSQTDVAMRMNLYDSKELQTRFNWRPEAISEIQGGLTQLIRGICTYAKAFVRSAEASGYEIVNKSYKTYQAVTRNMKPNLFNELNAISIDFKPLQNAFEDMYANDYFGIKVLVDFTSAFNIHRRIRDAVISWYSYASHSIILKSTQFITSTFNIVRQACEYSCTQWVELAVKRIQKVPLALLNSLDDIQQWGQKFINKVIIHGFRLIKDFVIDWIPHVNKWKEAAPQWTRQISATVSNQIHEFTSEFLKSKYFTQLQKSVHDLTNIFNEIYNAKFWTKAKAYYDYFSDQVQDRINTLKSYWWYQDLETFAEHSYSFGKWAYKFFRVDEIAKELLEQLLARVEDVIIFTIEDTLLPHYQLPTLTTNVLYEPTKGKFEFNQTLPVPWTSFSQAPNVFGSSEYQKLAQFKDDLLQLPKNSAKKLYRAVMSELTWKSVAPNVRASAVLAGNQHYVTFDGRAYEFSGACSYLLAHDFINNKFSLIVNYQLDYDNAATERVTIKSFNLTLCTHEIVITPDLQLQINGEVRDAPLAVETVKIIRTNDVLYISDEKREVFLTYNRKFEILKFEIGGFYHGKTGGLFGTYDHEPHDDLINPSHQKVTTIDEFGRSWEVSSSQCRDHKNYAYHSDVNSYTVQKTCKQLFNDHSLTNCLRKITKDAYVEMCINDVSLGISSCNSAAMYVTLCNAKGYETELPESCMKCDVGGSTIEQGQRIKLSDSSIQKSADIVFVLDNTWQCSTTFPGLRQVVATIARNLEQSLERVSLTKNRYAVVGLAGADVSSSPQAMTVDGEIFGNAQFIKRALNSTSFTAGHHHHISDIIDYAYDLPFRPGVTKILIALPCSEAVDNEADYDSLIEKIENVDMFVHLVSIHDATVKEPNKVKASDVVGFDADFAYTMKSIQRGTFVGSKEVLNQLTLPKNPLTKMALETDGSVFFASKLNSNQPRISSIANEIFSRRVAHNAIPSKCQNCVCTVGPDQLPKTVCSNCS